MSDPNEQDVRLCEMLDASLSRNSTEHCFSQTLSPDLMEECRDLAEVVAVLEIAVRCWKLLPEQQPATTSHAQHQPDKESVRHIGRYQVVGELGEGGMGTVYKARDPKLDRLVALKVPHFPGAKNVQTLARQRFEREARAVAQLRHPNICPIHDVGEHEGGPFAVLAYVEGGSLADALKSGPLVPNRAVELVRKVALGLEAAHQKAIVHRDIKPANILLDTDDEPLLSDFGLARSEIDPERLTVDGTILGTPSYMAPEQAAGNLNEIGPRSDVYSLGVVLYQVLTGHVPFKGNLTQLLTAIQTMAPPIPTSLIPGLDPALEGVVLKAMARRPEDRYQSALAFAEALRHWQSDSPQVEKQPPNDLKKSPTLPAPKRRVVWLLAAVPVLVLLTILFWNQIFPARQDGTTHPDWKFQDVKSVYEVVADHLRQTPESDRSGRCYLTLTHLANRAGDANASSVRDVRFALQELFSSGLNPRQTSTMLPIDKAETIFAVDLRALGWDSDGRWKTVQTRYPYGLKHEGDSAKAVRVMTDDDLPLLRADWFVVEVTRKPLWDKLIGLADAVPPTSQAMVKVRHHYESPLTEEDLAAELGLASSEPLLAKVRADEKFRSLGLAPLLEGKAVITREAWSSISGATSLFQKAARTLELGEPFRQRPD